MDFSKRPIKIFFSYYKPHIALFIADMLCAFFMAAIDVAFPMFSRYALNTLIPNHELRTFLILVAILLAGFCIQSKQLIRSKFITNRRIMRNKNSSSKITEISFKPEAVLYSSF